MPEQPRPLAADGGQECRDRLPRLFMHEVDLPALVRRARRRAAVAVAREHQAGESVCAAEAVRKILPHADRSQAFMQEHDHRTIRLRLSHPLVLDPYVALLPAYVGELDVALAGIYSHVQNILRVSSA